MKKFLSVAVISMFFLSAVQFVYAAGTPIALCPHDEGGSNYGVLCSLTPSSALPFLFTAVIIIAIIIALIFLIWGGIKWVISGGDKGKVDAARSTIVAAIVGLIIIFLAWFIINLITQIFFGTSVTNTVIPSINIGATPTP